MTGPGQPSAPAAILIGPPGAGKSTVGPLLAARLGVGFLDTDDRVEAVAGKPVGDIFVEDGEAAFRALEREAVAWAISAGRGAGQGGELRGGVIGLGGGAVLDPGTQRLLAGLPVVYLATGFAADADPGEAHRDGPGRWAAISATICSGARSSVLTVSQASFS